MSNYTARQRCVKCHYTETIQITVYGDYDGEFEARIMDPENCAFCKHYAKVMSGEVKLATDEEVEEWRGEYE